MVLTRQMLIFLVLLCFGLMPCAPTLAGTAGTAETQLTPTTATPGLSDLGPRLSALMALVEKSEPSLTLLADVASAQDDLATYDSQLKELIDKAAPLGDPNDWYIDRLNQFNNQFLQLKLNLEALQVKMTARQKKVEEISAKIRPEENFWQNWAKELKAQKIQVPVTTIRQVKAALERLNKAEKKTTGAILKTQEQISSLQQKVSAELDQFDKALVALRQATFRKNTNSFFSTEFRLKFTTSLWDELVQGFESTKNIDLAYLQRYAWAFGFLVAGLILSLFIRFSAHPVQEHQEWKFVTSHPFSAGIFIAIVLMGNIFPAPPSQLHFALMVAGVISGSILAADLVENRRQARMLYLAALVLILSTGFRLINLPQPLYRLYITGLALTTVPVLIGQIRTSLRCRGSKAGRMFRFLMRLAVGVLLIALIAQISGYMNFSSWLMQATFETGMLFMFAHMILRLGCGGVSFILHYTPLSEHKFFKRYSRELTLRIAKVLRAVVVIYSVFYLLPLWRLYASSYEAWTSISSYSVSLGPTRISIEMLVLASMTLYLTFQLSWLLQALFETRFFYRKSVDRGVRDAIKKLVHYAMVTIGFLTVLSTLGLSLQNFVVVLGAFGVGIGFGLQDIVNNFLSGLILLFERPVKVGDFIVVNEEWGTISKIGLRSTVVETINHSEIIVPNSQLISEKVTNWTFSSRVARLVVPVGVAYGSDVTLVMQILTSVATKHPEAVHDPAPSILFIEFGDSSLNFEIRVFVQDISSRFRIRSEILQQIDACFRESGVEIPFPQRDLHLRSVDPRILERAKPMPPDNTD